jgi:alkaline phosphatase D
VKRQFSRRRILTLAGKAAAGVALSPWFPRQLGWAVQPEDTGLSLPCAAGDVSSDSALVWFRTEKENIVAIEYGQDPAFQATTKSITTQARGDNDYTGKILLQDLKPHSTYYYRARVAGKDPGLIQRFVTAPRAEEEFDVCFAFSGDTRQSYRPFNIMDAIREQKPDFFLHLGDTVYADREGRARRLSQFREKYVENRFDGPTQRLFAETSLLVVWDDHEVADNFRATDLLAPVGRRAFMDFWPVRQEPFDPQRIYRSVRWGSAAELFILDARQYRDEAGGTILGAQQRQWFLDALANSTARFKLVCTSVPFSSPGADKWGGYPKDREAVLNVIAEKRIRGVIFLTADVHHAAVVRVPGNPALREIIVGPLAAQMGKNSGTAKRFEYFNNLVLNYGLVKIQVRGAQSLLEIEIRTDKNVLLHKIKFDANSEAI